MKNTTTEEYFKIYKEYRDKYGPKTVLLGQIGAFYEVAGLQNSDGMIMETTPIKEYSEICELSIMTKDASYKSHKVMWCGFQKQFIEKYLKKITSAGYMVILWDQKEDKPNSERHIVNLISAGTVFLNETQELSNNIACIWIHRYKDYTTKKRFVTIGISNIDNHTGRSNVLEITNEFYHNPTTYDEIEHFISIYKPSETIVVYNIETETVDDFIQYTNINSPLIRKINLGDADSQLSNDAKNCENQIYQDEILRQFYEGFDRSIHQEYHFNPIGCQSFCYLLNYIYVHNQALVKKIHEPVFEKNQHKLSLANHSLKQLNILNEQGDDLQRKNSSVLSLLNKCLTKSGKRHLNYELLNPSNNVEFLNESYEMIEHALDIRFDEIIHTSLSSIKDIEKLNRKLLMKKTTPYDFHILYDTLKSIKQLYTNIDGHSSLQSYLLKDIDISIVDEVDAICGFIDKSLDLSICKNINVLYFEKLVDKPYDHFNFVKKGVVKELDEKIESSIDSRDKLNAIVNYLSKILEELEKKKKPPVYIKVEETNQGYSHLLLTPTRANKLKTRITTLGMTTDIIDYVSSLDNELRGFEFDFSSIRVEKYTKSNHEIKHHIISVLTGGMKEIKEVVLSLLSNFYQDFLEKFCAYVPQITQIIEYIIRVDLLQNKCVVAKTYNCVKPLIEESERSFVDAKCIRHILIEQLHQRETYIANDLCLGKEEQGILLFGVNAVGKTSLIKALGICIIMAQMGFYVPCQAFTYFPYDYLFTRILGNDNIFKGLSTFEVEMSELRMILKYSTKNSLILGDELCSGTETNSALSIFVSSLKHIYERKSSFIFATHFHELNQYDEVNEMSEIVMKHMSTSYDEKMGTLVYNRILKEGSGKSIYGLEVCKSLDMPEEFITTAFSLQNKYGNINRNILSLKPSRYNKTVLKGVCQLCKKKNSKETHHVDMQKDANENNYVNDHHKNHGGNLIVVCEECHDMIHSKHMDCNIKKTKKGVKMEFTSSNKK